MELASISWGVCAVLRDWIPAILGGKWYCFRLEPCRYRDMRSDTYSLSLVDWRVGAIHPFWDWVGSPGGLAWTGRGLVSKDRRGYQIPDSNPGIFGGLAKAGFNGLRILNPGLGLGPNSKKGTFIRGKNFSWGQIRVATPRQWQLLELGCCRARFAYFGLAQGL